MEKSFPPSLMLAQVREELVRPGHREAAVRMRIKTTPMAVC
jgi:hypothetical protein